MSDTFAFTRRQALVATGAGLFIAIIAVLFLNHFNKRVRLALHQMDLLKVMQALRTMATTIAPNPLKRACTNHKDCILK